MLAARLEAATPGEVSLGLEAVDAPRLGRLLTELLAQTPTTIGVSLAAAPAPAAGRPPPRGEPFAARLSLPHGFAGTPARRCGRRWRRPKPCCASISRRRP